ncbi:hypothetical protein Bca52824_057223 [Brassica carinata]|uniref:VAN3-binding protein-like auxin canalisation domain-containing protein n=1 Tax=Brassica carinata TaxID=52824 RepID=A0A8X7QVR1_BRACI|nr:hypothetical protein Bca52824_057223 [Brassica carinata]
MNVVSGNVFVALVAASAGDAYYLSSSKKKRRGCLDPENGRLSKWFHQKQQTNPNTMRNPKRKDKERVERARVHSVVSITALAAGLSSVTSSESCSKYDDAGSSLSHRATGFTLH